MKILHKIKILSLSILTAIALTYPLSSLAVPWSEQHAFCLDHIIRSNAYSNYSKQKIYNECMDNADALIAKFDKSSKKDYEDFWRENAEINAKWHKENKAYKQSREIAEKIRKNREKLEIKKYDDLFSEFD